MFVFNGYKVMGNDTLTIPVVTPVIKRWWDKVIEWNPCNTDFIKPDFITTYKPDTEVYVMGDTIMAHPEVVAKLMEAVRNEQSNPFMVGP